MRAKLRQAVVDEVIQGHESLFAGYRPVEIVQLAGMLEHFADIDALQLDDVAPMAQPYPLHNIFREDVIAPGLDRDEVLAAAPAAEHGRFRVPPIIGLDL